MQKQSRLSLRCRLSVSPRHAIALCVLTLAGCGGGKDVSNDAEGRSFALQESTPQQLADTPTQSAYSEDGQLVRANENVAALGNDLFGDRVNLYTGGVEFVQTDVSLPGNSALPVSVGRRFVTGQPMLVSGMFGDWDLEIPHLHGIFAESTGWSVGSGAPTATKLRCSEFGPPPQAAGSPNSSASFNPVEYWNGSFLYVPGAGSQEILKAVAASPAVNPTGTLGTTATLTTKDRWAISCNTPVQNEAGGEGFTAVAPDGTRYRFDWIVSRPYTSISKPNGTPPENIKARTPAKRPLVETAPAPGSLLKRNEVWIMATSVIDRFGNEVKYIYDTAQPWRLNRIESAEGSNSMRAIDFEYIKGTNLVSSVSDGLRSWTYNYTDYVLNGSTQGKSLTSVTLPPGGGAWSIRMAGMGFSGASPTNEGVCDGIPSEISGGGPPPVGEMTHPSGATGYFKAASVLHGRSYVQRACQGIDAYGSGWSFYPRYFLSYALQSKTIGGPGLPPVDMGATNPSGYTWKYAYGLPNASFDSECANGCVQTKTVTVTDPQSVQTIYTFGNRFKVDEGQMLKTEEGQAGLAPIRTTTYEYASPTAGPYPDKIGDSVQARTAGDLSTRHTPQRVRTITQQAATFTWQANRFDRLARPVEITRFSSLGFSRTDRTDYADLINPADTRFTDKWVLGQVKSVFRLNGPNGSPIEESEGHDFDDTTLNPSSTRSFGRVVQTLSYHGDGNVKTRANGLGQTTRFENYKRGLARDVTYADNTSEHAQVNDIGLITAVQNAAGTTTTYGYDGVGRLERLTPPPEPNLAYNPTELRFEQVSADEVGLPAGHWRQVVTTGTAKTERFFDAMWRPVLSRTWDTQAANDTSSAVLKRFNANNQVVAQSYPRLSADIPSVNAIVYGRRHSYDALNRLVQTEQDSELGALISKVQYEDGFKRVAINPRKFSTTTWFQAFDTPSEKAPVATALPEGVTVGIGRDDYGKPTAITRAGVGVNPLSRNYFYDAHQRLCKTTEPESGTTLTALDAADNVTWRATGLAAVTGCDLTAAPEARKINYTYDLRNRLKSTSYGDGSPAITRTYTPDGLLQTIGSNGSTWTYTHNARRMLKQEQMALVASTGSTTNTYTLGWSINAQGNVDALTYPDNTQVQYAPNALGQATQVSGFASGATYHPNGAMAGYTLSNGVAHAMQQNVRQLPQSWADAGIVHDTYTYDENGNVRSISDLEQGAQHTATTRTMQPYDGLDRLTQVSGAWGNATYGYDALDNITTSTVGGRSLTHSYDATNRLTALSGTQSLSIDYDPNGNVARRGAQNYSFDLGNRLRSVQGIAQYDYDGHGRRTRISYANGTTRAYVYGQAGQLFYDVQSASVATRHIYLGGKRIAESYSGNRTPTFVYTDALGSTVAMKSSNHRLPEQTVYEPYGAVAAGFNRSGPGFTGHVNDPDTGLVQMQQRYYDPVAGRFLSVDPVTTDADTGAGFGRYHYANDNPYAFVDPTGRFPELSTAREKTEKKEEEACKDAVARGGSCYVAGTNSSANAGSSAAQIPTAPAGYAPVPGPVADGSSDGNSIYSLLYKADEFLTSLGPQGAVAAMPLKVVVRFAALSKAVKAEGMIYRAASGTPASLTPRAADLKGLSATDSLKNALPGINQIIDTSKLTNLCAVCDNPATGHMSILPKDISQMQGWISSRGAAEIHPLTRELMEAVVGTVKK